MKDALQYKGINVIGEKPVVHNYDTLCKEIIALGPGAMAPPIASDMKYLYYGFLSFNPLEWENLLYAYNTTNSPAVNLTSFHTSYKGDRVATLYERGQAATGTLTEIRETESGRLQQKLVWFDDVVSGDLDHAGFIWPGSTFSIFDKTNPGTPITDKYTFSLLSFIGYRLQLDQ